MRLLMPLRRAGARRRVAHLAAFWRRREGNVALEFALIAPVLLLLLLGLVDFGRAVAASRELVAAAEAAALFAVHTGNAETSRVEAEKLAQAAAGKTGASAAFEWSTSCRCGTSAAACDSLCADGRLPALYVEVALRASHPLLFNLPGLAESIPLTGRAVMRMR